MSLESQIAELVSATTALVTTFNGKKKEIELALADAVAAVPEMRRTWYVDQVLGLDSNTGTRAFPYKTIAKAMSATPIGGIADLRLLNDYDLDGSIVVEGRYIRLYGDGGVRKIITRYFKTVSNGTEVTWLTGFSMLSGSQCETQDIELILPSSAGVLPVPSGHPCSVFKTNHYGGLPILSVKLSGCKITAPDDFIGWLVGAPASATMLEVATTTLPAAFGGKYIYGVSAGTSTNTLSNVMSNLSTL